MIVLSSFKIHSQIHDWFGVQTTVTLPDRNYALPDRKWVLNTFYPWYKSELKRLGGSTWSEAWDCFSGDSPVVVKRDNTVFISALRDIQRHDLVLDHDGSWTSVNWVKKKPNKGTILTKCHYGILAATKDHKVVVGDNWTTHAESIYPDTIELSSAFESNSDISEDLAWVYGFFFSDGHCKHYEPNNTQSHKYIWKISNCNMEFLERANRVLGSDFVIKSFDSEQKGKVKGGIIVRNRLYNIVHSAGYGKTKPIVEAWQSIFYSDDYCKKVPDAILNSNPDICRAFLEGVYAGDGTKSKNGLRVITVKGKASVLGLQVVLDKLSKVYDIRPETRRKDTFYVYFDRKMDPLTDRFFHYEETDQDLYDINTQSGTLVVGNSKVKNCDDFARMFACLMQLAHRNAVGRGAAKDSFAEGIACAEIHFMQDNGVAHAINAIITKEDGLLIPVFIEPQTGLEVEVPAKSIWYTRF
jgi:hypothetical protein